MGALATAAAAVRSLRDAVPEPPQRLPQVIQFPVNDICNARCQMCFIWKNKRAKELTPEEVGRIAGDPLFREVRVVGLNGGEPTLRPDLAAIADALAAALPNLRALSLITNAWKHDLAIRRIDELAETCRANGLDFHVMVSVDGVGAVHDRVRGRTGNFAGACRVLDFAQQDRRIAQALIGCTVIRENVFGLEDLLDWAERRGVYARFRLGIPHQRLYNLEHPEPFQLTAAERYHFAAFLDGLCTGYEPEPARRQFYRSLRDQLVYAAPRRAGCAWKSKGVTLLPNGDLAYCAVASRRLGNALEQDASGLYWDNADHLREIVTESCARCAHDYDGHADRRAVLRGYAEKAVARLPAPAGRVARYSWHQVARPSEARRIRDASVAARTPPEARKSVVREDLAVLLTGWYGTETAGDKAILGGVVGAIRELAPCAAVDVASLEPYVTRETGRQMPELRLREVLSLEGARGRASAGAYDLVAVAGGPMMAGIAQVIDLLEIQAAAKRHGARTALLGCGIGPLGIKGRDRAIRTLVETADVAVLRDRQSVASLRQRLGSDAPASAALHPAFLWLDQARHSAPVPAPEDRIVLALRDWPIGEYAATQYGRAEAEEVKRCFEAELLAFVDEIARRSPATVIEPVAMHSRAIGGDDRAFYRRLFRERPEISARLDIRHRGPGAIAAAFRGARAALTMRFHGLVFALASETPVIAIDYTLGGKVAGLLDDLGRRDLMRDLAGFDGREAAELALAPPPAVPSLVDAIGETRQVLRDALRSIALVGP